MQFIEVYKVYLKYFSMGVYVWDTMEFNYVSVQFTSILLISFVNNGNYYPLPSYLYDLKQ